MGTLCHIECASACVTYTMIMYKIVIEIERDSAKTWIIKIQDMNT